MRPTHLIRALGLLPLALSLVCLTPGSPAANAATDPASRIELRPSDAHGNTIQGTGYYQVVARPGSAVQLNAFVGNRGSQRAGINLVPVDAVSGEYGAVSYNLPTQPRKIVGAWVTLSHRWVSLAAGRGMVVPLTVHVPRRVQPGQYIGGLTAFVPAPAPAPGHGIALTVQTRVIDAIEITVPGPSRAGFRVLGANATYRSDDVTVLVHLQNTGTVLLKGHGYLWVYAPHSAKPWIHRAFSIDITVPGTTIDYPLPWAHRVPPGVYRYAVSISWDRGGYQTPSAPHLLQWAASHVMARGIFHSP